MTIVAIGEDSHVKIDEAKKVAILCVNGWETFINYDHARDITADSQEVKALRRIN